MSSAVDGSISPRMTTLSSVTTAGRSPIASISARWLAVGIAHRWTPSSARRSGSWDGSGSSRSL
ncbi:MAG: hypothetical protein K5924_02930 [Chloroflexi bacterium]|nr:hypothetical protein [Chloroflexota bacterium]